MKIEGSLIADIAPSRCRVCGSTGEWLYRALEDGLFGARGSWNMRRCPDELCGLLWLDPMPTDEENRRAYDGYYTHHPGDATHDPTRFFFFRLFHAWQRFTRLTAERARMATMSLDGLPPGALLEIGCGSGMFLNRMRELGWSVAGLDLDPEAVSLARRKYAVEARVGTLEESEPAEGTFDAVVLGHAIEHLRDPFGTLRKCRRVLRTGGRLSIVTPNAASYGHRRFGAHWRGLEPPRHLYLFSPSSLRRAVERAGFRVERIWTSAANAPYVYFSSIGNRRGEPFREGLAGEPFGRLAASAIFTFYEHLLNRRSSIAGEELVLEAVK